MKNKIRVLMLDDNENIVNAVKEHFSSHAVIDIVLTCHDGKKGYDMILEKEKEYDVIVMDLIMPTYSAPHFGKTYRLTANALCYLWLRWIFTRPGFMSQWESIVSEKCSCAVWGAF